MSSSPAVQINISRTQLIALIVILLTTTTAATVNIRDTTKMFDRLDMDGNPITNLQDPNNPQDAATKNYVDNNGGNGNGMTIPSYNDISSQRQLRTTYTNNHNGPRLVTVITGSFNAANRLVALVNGERVQGYGSEDSSSEGLKTVSFLVPQGANYRIKTQGGQDSLLEWYEQDLQGGSGGGTGEDGQTGGGGLGDGTGLEWYKSSTTNEDYSDDKTFSFGCPSGENLVAYHGATAHSGQEDTPPPWYGSWLGPIDTSGNIDYGHPGRVNNHIAGRVTAINSSDTDSLSVSIRMDPPAPGESATFATINVGCLPGQ